MISEDALLERVKDFVKQAGSQKEAAKKIGCSLGYLNDYLHGRRDAGKKILDSFNLMRTSMYIQKN